jgi:hypothetical protein
MLATLSGVFAGHLTQLSVDSCNSRARRWMGSHETVFPLDGAFALTIFDHDAQ